MNHYAILLAWVLDLALKDPFVPWHPVRLIGSLINSQEAVYRRYLSNEIVGGFLLSVVTVSVVWLFCKELTWAVGKVGPIFGFAANALLIFFSIAPSALADEGLKIHRLLAEGRDDEARKELSMIVGRDTAHLSREEVARAVVETIAENSVDALTSPLFFAAIGGGPLAMAYKAVNTCDSMVGYRNEKYEKFGKVSARVDDAANFIPARLSIIFISVASFVCRFDAVKALRTGLKDRLKHPSPNSAHGEAMFAGALGVRLGGASSYGGVEKEKQKLGEN
jgi:adenosylcobinamide-phosphate synthase